MISYLISTLMYSFVIESPWELLPHGEESSVLEKKDTLSALKTIHLLIRQTAQIKVGIGSLPIMPISDQRSVKLFSV